MIALKKVLGSLEFEKYNKIKGYSSMKYPFKYKPKEVGEIYIQLYVYFEKTRYSP